MATKYTVVTEYPLAHWLTGSLATASFTVAWREGLNCSGHDPAQSLLRDWAMFTARCLILLKGFNPNKTNGAMPEGITQQHRAAVFNSMSHVGTHAQQSSLWIPFLGTGKLTSIKRKKIKHLAHTSHAFTRDLNWKTIKRWR